jgi:hypothetical protein
MKLCGYDEYKEIFETVKKLGKEHEPDQDLGNSRFPGI